MHRNMFKVIQTFRLAKDKGFETYTIFHSIAPGNLSILAVELYLSYSPIHLSTWLHEV